jgi:PHD/YefM family antitoxin component YafN of YafNO toxin-antitoxin module
MTVEKARADFSDVLSRAKYSGEPTIITKHGKEYAGNINGRFQTSFADSKGG